MRLTKQSSKKKIRSNLQILFKVYLLHLKSALMTISNKKNVTNLF